MIAHPLVVTTVQRIKESTAKKISSVEKSHIRVRFKQKYTVGNKAKGRISKRVFEEDKVG